MGVVSATVSGRRLAQRTDTLLDGPDRAVSCIHAEFSLDTRQVRLISHRDALGPLWAASASGPALVVQAVTDGLLLPRTEFLDSPQFEEPSQLFLRSSRTYATIWPSVG